MHDSVQQMGARSALDAYSTARVTLRVERLGVTKAQLPWLPVTMLGILCGAFSALALRLITCVSFPPFYIYSNPVTLAEASAALCAVNTIDSDEGGVLLEVLRQRTL